MRNKKTKLLAVLSTLLILALIYFLFLKDKKNSFNMACEKLISSDVSVIIRFDDLDTVWSDFKKTNFYVHFEYFSKWFFREMPSETLGFTNDIKDEHAYEIFPDHPPYQHLFGD